MLCWWQPARQHVACGYIPLAWAQAFGAAAASYAHKSSVREVAYPRLKPYTWAHLQYKLAHLVPVRHPFLILVQITALLF